MNLQKNSPTTKNKSMETEVITVSGSDMLEAINRSEVDIQVATAHRFPRDIEKCRANILALAAMDDTIAYNCFYHLERKDKDGNKSVIEGPSIRLAEIIAASWKNLRIAARIIGNDGKTITAQGVCHDLETNVAYSVETKRSILTSKGYTYSQDMQVVVGNAAAAIALRNAICKVVPAVLINSCIKSIQQKALEHIKKNGVSSEWINCLGYMQKYYKLTEKEILDYIGRKSSADVTAEDIQKLGGVCNAINEKTTTVEEVFKKPKEQKSIAKQVEQQAAASKQKAEESMKRTAGRKEAGNA